MRVLLVFLMMCSFVFGQNINKLDENGKKHGVWKGVYEESKRPRYEGTFDHGKEVGVFKFFDDTKAGTVIATRDFSSLDNSCYTIFYNQKGSKVSEGRVVNKQLEGEWKYYHEDSPQLMAQEFYTNGKLNGTRKVYYKNGNIAEEMIYKNGVKEGLYKNFAENGFVLEEALYKNGEYDGQATFRNTANKITAQGFFKNGKKVGVWKILEKDALKDVNMDKQVKKFQKRSKPIEN